ncbi:sulfatase [Verrucomicrobiaceae bacterium N1E253]|uniref:Sulfatase n=1 Tax=Oceaniferula marina TaxID=2748318 RepID=A0A851GP33_9BACT|nr:sulfatase [Oceaniferula marina]NWK56885.1 sulfatase [Oceaniferula marina]
MISQTLKNRVIKAAFLLIACCVLSVDAREALDRPNVIIFFVDDSGYGDYEHNGNPVIATPNITKLAQEGVNFTQFYVSTAACSASRYALLTGRYPGRSGLGSWVIGPGSKRHIHTKEVTIAEALKDRGYATGMFGKWHLGSPNKANGMSQDTLPLAHGFDQWVGTNVSHDYGNAMLLQSDPQGDAPVKGYRTLAKNLPSDIKASESLTGRYTDAAVSFIKQNKDKPFFAYIAHNQPHLGLFASDKFKGVSKRGLLGDVMAELDDSVGRVLKALEDEGIRKNTLVIYSSDNGPWVMFRNAKKTKYGEARMHVGYAWPFRDGKGSTWEGGHRIPGIFSWPGVIDAHSVVREPASTMDVFPTLMKLSGAAVPDDRSIDGRDISPYLLGTKREVEPFEFLYSYSDNKPSAIRMGPWKLHIRTGSQTGNQYGFKASEKTPLLFNVEEDLHERFDRAGEQPERVQLMKKRLLEKEKQLIDEASYWGAVRPRKK